MSQLDSLLTFGSLDKTFLLLMGDHGFRMDFSFGGTEQGKIEASMPALALLPPKHFSSQHPDKAKDQNFSMNISKYMYVMDIVHSSPNSFI